MRVDVRVQYVFVRSVAEDRQRCKASTPIHIPGVLSRSINDAPFFLKKFAHVIL